MNSSLGNLIQSKRKLAHLSTHDLSAELLKQYTVSVSAMTVSRVEHGNVISSDKLFAIASLLKIDLNQFTNEFPKVK